MVTGFSDELLSRGTTSIQVDDRESAGAVLPLLRVSSKFRIFVAHLPLGDYLVDGRFLFERKTMPDLMVSIITGRLFDQALRLAGAQVRSAIILEGTSRELVESGMHWEAIQGALVTVTLFCGLPLLRTRTPEDTVRTMLYTARQGKAHALGALPRTGYRPRGKRARQLFILQGLPGIGPQRASRLLARWGSIERIVTAAPEELAAVSGIGTQTARRIRWAVEQPSSAYRQGARRVRSG